MKNKITIIPKEMTFPEARVLDEDDRILYEEVSRKTAERFGENSQAYKTIANGIDARNVTGSQFFWNTNLGMYLPEGQRVISMEDTEAINDLDEEFFRGFYTDMPEIILRTKIPFWDKNEYILENLANQVKEAGYQFSSENPLRINGLELVESDNSDNEYGLSLKVGKRTKIQNDKRFAYSNNQRKVPFGDKQKTIWTRKVGLSRLYLGKDETLHSSGDHLSNSNDNGRVVLVSNAENGLQKHIK